MKLTINYQQFRITRAVAMFVESRVRATLGRLAARAEAILVTVGRRPHAGSGGLKDCRVQVSLPGLPPIMAAASNSDLYVAISSACVRAGAVARQVELRRQRMAARRRESWSRRSA